MTNIRYPGVERDPSKSLPYQDHDRIAQQLDRFARARDGMQSWAEKANQCVRFREGQQWDEQDVKQLQAQGRPALTLNKISPLVRLLVGYFRQNRRQITFRPAGEGVADTDVAETLGHIAKNIQEVNGSRWNDPDVFAEGIVTGRGFWDIRISFAENLLGEVKETTLDPFSVYIDPEAETYDPKGWTFVQNSYWLSPEDIEKLYGSEAMDLLGQSGVYGTFPVTEDYAYDPEHFNRPQSQFSSDIEDVRELSGYTQYGASMAGYNIFDHINRQRRLIRVLETQHYEMTTVEYIVDMQTGDKRHIPKDFPRQSLKRILEYAQAQGQPVDVMQQTKRVPRFTVTAGDRLLYDDWSPYGTFTVVPYFPYFRRGVTMGLVEDLIDPQMEVNKRRSAQLDSIMRSATAGWVYPEEGLSEEMQRELEDEGSKPGIHVRYRQGFDPPQRIQPPVAPNNLRMLEEAAVMDLKEIAGINESALGQQDSSESGKAIMAKQRQAVVAAEGYFDNFDRSLEHKGEKYVELVQGFYTEPRILHIRGADERGQKVAINTINTAGEVLNNVTVGRYDVVVDTTPATASFQDSQFDEAMQMAQVGVPLPPDILIDLSSMPRKDEVKERVTQAKQAEGQQQAAAKQKEEAQRQEQAQTQKNQNDQAGQGGQPQGGGGGGKPEAPSQPAGPQSPGKSPGG